MLPRKISPSNTHHHETVESLYRKYYFEIVESLYQYYFEILDKCIDEIGEKIWITNIHIGEDLHDVDLCTELAMLKNTMQGIQFSVTSLKEKLSVYQQLFPQVSKLFRLLLTMPGTSATSERSFLSLRSIKTYLRTTMKQERLNHLMMI